MGLPKARYPRLKSPRGRGRISFIGVLRLRCASLRMTGVGEGLEGAEGEGGGVGVAGLFFEFGPVDGAAVEAWGGAGF